MKKMTRLEANKEVRRTLNRHLVDLSYCQYSVAGMDVRLNGKLYKIDQSEFNSAQIEALIYDFQRALPHYSISGEFDNWNFSTDHISYVGEKKKVIENDIEFIAEDDSESDSEAS